MEELLLYGCHEPLATQTYSEILRPGLRVLDVGANIGYYMAVAAAKIGPGGSMLAVEPDPDLACLARTNAEALPVPATVVEGAVSDRSGEAFFYPSTVSNWGSLRQDESLLQGAPKKVRCFTIDELCSDFGFEPDIVRMDIEGAEAKALAGASETLRRHPVLFIELHRKFLSDGELAYLEDVLCEYDHFIVINRRYDWPWCLNAAKRQAVHHAHAGNLKRLINDRTAAPVMTIFAMP